MDIRRSVRRMVDPDGYECFLKIVKTAILNIQIAVSRLLIAKPAGGGLWKPSANHALGMNSKGLLFVGDRSNNRVQICDRNDNIIVIWYQFGRPGGIYFDKNDVLYSADSESGSVDPNHGDWFRGIRIGTRRLQFTLTATE